MTMFVYIIVLLLLGLLFVFLEMFVPGGIIGTIGVVMMASSTLLCFSHYGTNAGILVFLICAGITILFAIFFFTVFPHTAEGRWIIMKHTLVTAKGSHSETARHRDWIGCEGIAESKLRPVGIALIEGERLDVMTEGEFIEPETRIRVLRVDGNRIIVIPV